MGKCEKNNCSIQYVFVFNFLLKLFISSPFNQRRLYSQHHSIWSTNIFFFHSYSIFPLLSFNLFLPFFFVLFLISYTSLIPFPRRPFSSYWSHLSLEEGERSKGRWWWWWERIRKKARIVRERFIDWESDLCYCLQGIFHHLTLLQKLLFFTVLLSKPSFLFSRLFTNPCLLLPQGLVYIQCKEYYFYSTLDKRK